MHLRSAEVIWKPAAGREHAKDTTTEKYELPDRKCLFASQNNAIQTVHIDAKKPTHDDLPNAYNPYNGEQ